MNPNEQQATRMVNLLYAVNQLALKAVSAESAKALRFIILNDTIGVIRYDRALLWSFRGNKATLEGVSGQSNVTKSSEFAEKWHLLLDRLKDPSSPQFLTESSFKEGTEEVWRELHNHSNVGVLWVPVKKEEDLVLGLWLERWHQDAAGIPPQETVKLITQTLAPAFAASWKHLHRGRQWLSALREKKTALIATSIILVLALFAIRVPLRVVAPCEVVAREPIYITAPIEGIIDQLVVTPGALVKEGDLLYRYNADEALSNLSVATKQVELMQRSVQRAIALGSTDEKALRELSLLRIKLEQEQARLKLAQTVADKSEGRAPVAGIAVIDDPERWRGRPVQIGEKILTVSDPSKTKVRIWLPESDNIALNKDEPLKVYLNVDPSTSYEAQMTYIANGSSLNEHKLPSFISDAEWLSDSPPDRIGLKGTAIAYGDKVSLFYYLLRRPWTSFRNYVGI